MSHPVSLVSVSQLPFFHSAPLPSLGQSFLYTRTSQLQWKKIGRSLVMHPIRDQRFSSYHPLCNSSGHLSRSRFSWTNTHTAAALQQRCSPTLYFSVKSHYPGPCGPKRYWTYSRTQGHPTLTSGVRVSPPFAQCEYMWKQVTSLATLSVRNKTNDARHKPTSTPQNAHISTTILWLLGVRCAHRAAGRCPSPAAARARTQNASWQE